MAEDSATAFDLRLAALIKRARELREVGVLEVVDGDFRATLAPNQDPEAKVETTQADHVEAPFDAWSAPLTDGARAHLEVIEENGKRR